MQFHPVNPNESIIGPAAKPPVQAADQIKAKGIEILGQQPSEANVDNLSGKKLSKAPPYKVAWQKVARFFKRHFSKIDEADSLKAAEIKKLANDVQEELTKAAKASRVVASKEKELNGAFPSATTVEIVQNYLPEAQACLKKAKECYGKLTLRTAEAETLAEAHARFDAIPTTITTLENSINQLEGQIALAESLLKMEKGMKDYDNGKTWVQFAAIIPLRRKLYEVTKELITQNPAYKNDPSLKKYAVKPVFTGNDTYHLISRLHPDLKVYIERLLDNTIEMITQRVTNLSQKVDEIYPLFAKYKALGKEIDHLEVTIHDKFIYYRIYRLFYPVPYLTALLEKAEKESQKIYDELQTRCRFDASEIEWLEQKSAFDADFVPLLSDIKDLQKGLSYLETRDPLSSELSALIQKMSEYQAEKFQYQLSQSPVLKAKYDETVRFIKMNIISDLTKNLAPKIKQLKEGNDKPLPPKFSSLPPFEQFQILIPLVFPSLQIKANIFEDLIEKQGLKDDFDQAILAGEKTPPVLTEALAAGEQKPVKPQEEPLGDEVESQTKVATPDIQNPSQGAPPPPPPPPSMLKYDAIEGQQPLSLADPLKQKKVSPEFMQDTSTTMDHIKKGVILNKVPDQPPKVKVAKTAHEKLLESITLGKTLKPVNKTPKKVFIRTFDEMQTFIAAGGKMQELTDEERKSLSMQEVMALAVLQKGQNLQTETDEDEESDSDDWNP